MIKPIVFIAILLNSLALFAQELAKTIPLQLPKKTELFQVVNENKKQVLLFFNDKKEVRTVRLNENLEIVDSLTSARPDADYADIIGYSIANDSYSTYWSGTKNQEIVSQNFDFNTHKVALKTFQIAFEKERTIERVTVNNIFYLITIVKNTSILNFYIFKDNQMEKKTIDLTDKLFLNAENQKTTLWKIFEEETLFQKEMNIQNILQETPPSLTFSANKRKAFVVKDNLIFTFDGNQNFTQTLKFNLTHFDVTQKAFSQPYVEADEYGGVEHNSFYINENLIQMKLNDRLMLISVKNEEGTEIKKYQIIADQDIDIKNSDIIQENGKISNTRILGKSNQLLRKIFNENPSISCYAADNKIYTTIGSVSLLQNNNNAVVYGSMIGGLTGALIAAAITSNFSMNNLNSYNNRKVVYIYSVFDANFNHINDPLANKLPFDTLRMLAEEKDYLTCQTVFKFNANLYYGGYDKTTGLFSFYKFKN